MGIERSIEKKQRETGREVSQVCHPLFCVILTLSTVILNL